MGDENTYGTCVGRVKAGPMTLRALLDRRPRRAVSAATSARANSPTIRSRPSAARAWWRFPALQKLLRYICENGFEHHVAANLSTVADAVHEATTRYLGWDTSSSTTEAVAP